MQDLSYPIGSPIFIVDNLTFSVQIFTFENVYALNADRCVVTEADGMTRIEASGLTWAGAQEQADGTVSVLVQPEGRHVRFTIAATAPATIRSVKLVIHNAPRGDVINLREAPRRAVPDKGLILHYPDGWRSLYTPLVVTQKGEGEYFYYRSLDTIVRSHKFAFVPRSEGMMDAEIVFEQLATRMSSHVDVPPLEVGSAPDLQSIMDAHQAHIERAYQLVPWEARTDVPAWMHEVALVAAIHCQHYSGYIFNTYADALEKARWLADHFEPERTLIYLPGWEGRYYWQYGDYRPDPRMGGAAGFEQMVRGMRDLGQHVMPMFGANVVNKGMANFEQWGTTALASSPSGNRGSGSVDWDGSRHYDHGWGAFLNVGAPPWQNRLVSQITALVQRYGFDAVFLDISAGWMNDPLFEIYPGTRQLVSRIREAAPDLLVAGEGWYDAVGAATPLMQNGHTEGVMHPHDNIAPAFFDTYNRAFGHLCLGDPSRGSTGVHELGINPAWREPLRKGILPTLTLVEDSLRATDKVQMILEDARAYAARYLTVAPLLLK